MLDVGTLVCVIAIIVSLVIESKKIRRVEAYQKLLERFNLDEDLNIR